MGVPVDLDAVDWSQITAANYKQVWSIPVPTKVPLNAAVSEAVAHDDSTCFLLESGEIWCTGSNFSPSPALQHTVPGGKLLRQKYGAVCLASADNAPVCLGEAFDPPTLATLHNISEWSWGSSSCTLDYEGVVRCWGGNNRGGLGDGNGFYPLPTDVAPLVPLD